MKKLPIIGALAAASVLSYMWLSPRISRAPSEETSPPLFDQDLETPSPEPAAPGARQDGATATTLLAPDSTGSRRVATPSSRRQRILDHGNVRELKERGRALRANQLEQLGLSSTPAPETLVTTNHGTYATASNFWAVPASSYTGGGTVVRRALGHVFLKAEEGSEVPSGARAAVYSPEQGTFGILSGGFLIALRPGADALSLTRDYPVSLVPQSEDKITFYRSNATSGATSSESLSQLLGQLQADARVSSVRLEVIEHGIEPK